MDLKYLTTFRTIVEAGSFTTAAEKLNYTQSTITFQIDQLEKELNTQLFEKVGRRMQLTASGKALIPYAQQVLDSVDRLRGFQSEIDVLEGELRIGVAESFLSYELPPVLKSVMNRVPQAKLHISSMNCYDIRNALIDGSLDIGFFYQDIGGNMSSLSLTPVQTYPIVMIASPRVAAQIPAWDVQEQTWPVPFIINEKRCVFRQIFEQYLKERHISLTHTIELGSIATIKKLVQNDVGISFLPRFTVSEELKNGSLVEIQTAVVHNSLTLVMGVHKNKWLSPLLKLVMDTVREQFDMNQPETK